MLRPLAHHALLRVSIKSWLLIVMYHVCNSLLDTHPLTITLINVDTKIMIFSGTDKSKEEYVAVLEFVFLGRRGSVE